MTAAVFLFVDKPVALLEFELDTSGLLTLTVPPAAGKQLQTNRDTDTGRLIVFISGMNLETFSGKFLEVSMPVRSIQEVVTANPDGSDAGATITMISKPSGLHFLK